MSDHQLKNLKKKQNHTHRFLGFIPRNFGSSGLWLGISIWIYKYTHIYDPCDPSRLVLYIIAFFLILDFLIRRKNCIDLNHYYPKLKKWKSPGHTDWEVSREEPCYAAVFFCSLSSAFLLSYMSLKFIGLVIPQR